MTDPHAITSLDELRSIYAQPKAGALRKSLSAIAIDDPAGFKAIVDQARGALAG